MGKIHVMTDALASQVAAGEVVERPASVVKELVENSLDSGAGRVEVLAERGGAALIRVIDDGAGMSREDALLSVERHATSKLREKEDLARVTTFGFRGEALPSIASVSRFRMATREREALAGTEIIIEGGRMKEVRDCGDAPGTQIEVRSLFFNVPARRKFLRAEATEFGHIEAAVRIAAISRPDVAFSLRHGTRQVFHVGAAGGRFGRIVDLAGAQVADHLVEVVEVAGRGGLRASGWVGRPGFTRPNRALQYVFLNGRAVDVAPITIGLREAYSGMLERGQHPPVFLFIEADPASVDVNVHPAKREVRFHDGRGVQELVREAVRSALSEQIIVSGGAATLPQPSAVPKNVDLPEREIIAAGMPEAPPLRPVVVERSVPVDLPITDSARPSAEPRGDGDSLPSASVDPAASPEPFQLIGQLGERYLILESDDGLVLLHRRAAHERILYEEALAAMDGTGVAAQALLSPGILELSPEDYQVAMAHAEALEKLGVGFAPFGENTLKIDSLPAICSDSEPAGFVSKLIADLREGGVSAGRRQNDRQLAAAVSHRAARYHEATHPEERRALVMRLMKCDMPYCDPRGRSTLIQFSYQELARKFGEK